MSKITEHPYSVRIEYTYEAGTWWAYASLQFSSADESLAELKHRTQKALHEILGPDLEYVEIVNEPTPFVHPWNSPDLNLP